MNKIKKLILVLFVFQIILSFEEIIPGLSYQHTKQKDPDPLSIHVIKIDPNKIDIKLKRAAGKGMEREEPSSIAKREGAIVACNGANYRRGGRFNGNPLNLLKIGDKIYSDPQFCRGVLAWNSKGRTVIEPLKLRWRLKINNKEYPIDRVNQPRGTGERILYNDSFHSHTLTNIDSYEIILKNNKVISVNEKENSKIT